jgi:hypothetical protein
MAGISAPSFSTPFFNPMDATEFSSAADQAQFLSKFGSFLENLAEAIRGGNTVAPPDGSAPPLMVSRALLDAQHAPDATRPSAAPASAFAASSTTPLPPNAPGQTLTPEQQAVFEAPPATKSAWEFVAPPAGTTPLPPQTGGAPLSIQGGQLYEPYYTPDWDAVGATLNGLLSTKGGNAYNVAHSAAAPLATREPAGDLYRALTGYGYSPFMPPSEIAFVTAARAQDTAAATAILGAQAGAISRDQAAEILNALGTSAPGAATADDPALQPGYQIVLGNYGQSVTVEGGSDAAVSAFGASGAAGLPGANGGDQTGASGWGNQRPVAEQYHLTPEQAQQATAAAIDQAASYLATHYELFGLGDAWAGLTAEQRYQAAYYVQSHPAEFTMQDGRLVQVGGAH